MQFEERFTKTPEEIRSATVYFNPEEGADAPEILLFEESLVSTGSRKEKVSKRLRERIRDRYEHIATDLFAGEHFIHRLKHFKKITVLLNRPIDPTLVRERLHAIFRDRSYHHLRWLIIDGILAPLSVLLAPLPGPNVVGYYLVFRVLAHWRSYRSASKAALEEIDVQVSNQAEEVNTLLRGSANVRAALQELRKKYGLRALQEHKFVPQFSMFKEGWARLKHGFHHEESR